MPQFEHVPTQFEAIKDFDEVILWSGKPSFIPFLAQGIPFLIIGIVWLAFDLMFFENLGNSGFNEMGGFITIFMLLHLFPFWGSLLNMMRLILIYRNVNYAITTKRVMLRSGFFGIDIKTIDLDKILNLEVNVGPLENLFHVGSIRIFSGETTHTKNGIQSIHDIFKAIAEPYAVFKQLKQSSMDIRADINYPNQLRPDQNPGYSTTYKR